MQLRRLLVPWLWRREGPEMAAALLAPVLRGLPSASEVFPEAAWRLG